MNCALHFLSEDLAEQPIFPVEPKHKLPGKELTFQQNFRKLLKRSAPTVSSHGVPNAGKRGLKAQRSAKAEGLTAGVFDEQYAAPNAWLAILEWKDCDGDLSRAQIAWGNMMHRKGFRVACVRTPEFAEQLFRNWGCPFITRENRL